MALEPGSRIGSYEIVEQIGSGGMGEVWRATDATLGRDVALKVLPESRHLDPDAVLRFEREARMLAALNHPNIATLHGLETSGDVQALIMELVEGESLDTKISLAPRGMPVGEALEIAEQILAALEAAHERGVVHRDLKPANIKIRPDGTVKVLDFGIAKALATDISPSSVGTVTQMPGAVIGTPSYMSPEQASGADVDRRTDIWAFGCVLYEMLTGKIAFDGDTSSRILARVLEREPDWDSLSPAVPSRIRTLLGQCLEKNLRRRRRDAGDLRLELALAADEPADKVSANRRGFATGIAWLVGLAGIALLGTAVALYLLSAQEPPPQTVLDVATPASMRPDQFAMSPDGRYVAFVAAVSADSIRHTLYLRDIRTGEQRQISGTAGAALPCWSPDSRSIAFFAGEYLRRVDINGGNPQRLAPALNARGCSWGESGQIVFTPSFVTGVYSVPADGSGTHRPVTQIDLDREPDDPDYEPNHAFPSFIPGTDTFLYYALGGEDVKGLYIGSLDERPAKRLMASDSTGVFVAPDWLVYGQNGRLVARRLDLALGEWTSQPMVLAESIVVGGGGFLPFSSSHDGDVFVYRDMPQQRARLFVFDRSGTRLANLPAKNGPEVSSDDRLIAYDNTVDSRDIYVANLDGSGENRITDSATVEGYPLFSPDDAELIYEKQRTDDEFFELWRLARSRPYDQQLFYSEAADLRNLIPLDWTVNDYVIARRSDRDFLSSDLIAISTVDTDPEPVLIASSPLYEERLADVSPDGGWIAYDSDQPGQYGVFVQAFPDSSAGPLHAVTSDGFAPRWSADGSEIYFLTLDGRVMAAAVTVLESGLHIEEPEALFPRAWIGGPGFNHSYAVTSDGRFLINVLEVDESPPPITVVQHSPVFGSQ